MRALQLAERLTRRKLVRVGNLSADPFRQPRLPSVGAPLPWVAIHTHTTTEATVSTAARARIYIEMSYRPPAATAPSSPTAPASSGAARLDATLEHLGRRDAVVVQRLDRHGRSLRHLIELAADLESRGDALVSLKENLDTTTRQSTDLPCRRGLAEFERGLIRAANLSWPGSCPGRGPDRRPTHSVTAGSCRPLARCTREVSTILPPSRGNSG